MDDRDKLEIGLEMFASKGWKEAVLKDIITEFKVYRDNLTDAKPSDDTDIPLQYLQGYLQALRWVLGLEAIYKRDRADEEEDSKRK